MIKTGAKNNKKETRRSRTVRKTITMDGDLASEVHSFVLENDESEKTVINNLIRSGLIYEKRFASGKNEEFSLPSFPKGIGGISRRELNAMLVWSD